MTKPLSLSRMAALSAALLAADEEAWATSVDALDYATQLEAKLDALKAALQRRYYHRTPSYVPMSMACSLLRGNSLARM